jgi:hypothetical protein
MSQAICGPSAAQFQFGKYGFIESLAVGSGSGIRCLFDPWIRDRLFPDPGSRIPNPYFRELSDNFLDKKFYNSLKICPSFFLQHFKSKIIFNFVKFVAT